MAEYIEREALLKKRFNMHMGFCGSVAVVTVEDIENESAADVAKVVRCKDCNKGEPSSVWDGWIYCQANVIHHDGDNFCSYGERREENEL